MGFVHTEIGHILVFVVGVGLILLTGWYRVIQDGFGTMPLVGIALVVVGLSLFGGRSVVDLGCVDQYRSNPSVSR